MAGLAPFLRPVYQIMQLQKLVNMFGGDLTRRYGQKVHKLTLHGGFSCPNRDGTIGRGGCTFCNVASFADEAQQHRSIAEQLAHQANLVNAIWPTFRRIPAPLRKFRCCVLCISRR